MRVRNGRLVFTPLIPEQWKSFSFKVWFRDNLLKVEVSSAAITIINEEGPSLAIEVLGLDYKIASNSILNINK
jgi:maltose phosphorylase